MPRAWLPVSRRDAGCRCKITSSITHHRLSIREENRKSLTAPHIVPRFPDVWLQEAKHLGSGLRFPLWHPGVWLCVAVAPERPHTLAVSVGLWFCTDPPVPRGPSGLPLGHPVGGSRFSWGRRDLPSPATPPSSHFRVFFPGPRTELLFAGHSVILTQYK